jgi:phosphoribosylformimino-5-aminoimidazole carboxamide ribonucleotide (ProFAR) isomerase
VTAVQPQPSLETGDLEVAAARFAAGTASLRSSACWTRYVEAVERDGTCDGAKAELAAAMAEQVYAWSVYHSVLAESRGEGP